MTLAEQAIQLGDLERGREQLQSALARARFVAQKPRLSRQLLIALSYEALASLAEAEGNYEEAVSHFRTAMSIRKRVNGPNSPGLFACAALAWNLVRIGKISDGRAMHERMIALPEETSSAFVFELHNTQLTVSLEGPTAQALANSWTMMGVSLNDVGSSQESLRYFETSLELSGLEDGARELHVATTLMHYARALDALGRESEAVLARDRAGDFLYETHYSQKQIDLYGSLHGLEEWLQGGSPLTVSIRRPPFKSRKRAREFKALAVAAVETWQRVLSEQTGRELRIVKTDADALIRIGWSRIDPDAPNRLGFTRPRVGEDEHTVVAMDISIHYGRQNDSPPAHLSWVLLHELGHAMGIMIHSPHPGDLMFASLNDSWREAGITPRDALTLYTLSVAGTPMEGTGSAELGRASVYRRDAAGKWERVVGQGLERGEHAAEGLFTYDEMQELRRQRPEPDAEAGPQPE